jgi:predicted ATP-dependent endonuclease of OLD family
VYRKTVQIADFRRVEDSEPFTLDQVTCLVGKHESDKTALLQALYRLC